MADSLLQSTGATWAAIQQRLAALGGGGGGGGGNGGGGLLGWGGQGGDASAPVSWVTCYVGVVRPGHGGG